MDYKARQIWRPLGRVVEPLPAGDWWVSHASYPTVLKCVDGSLVVYFSVRDAANRSSLACVNLSIDGDRFTIEGTARGPLLMPGPRGSFDADGVTATSFIQDGDRLLAYYLGWTVGVSVPFTNTIGVAEAQADGSFARLYAAPIVGRSLQNPFTLGYPWVVRTQRGFEMFFGTHLCWGAKGLAMSHVIKRAVSTDGIYWEQEEGVVVPLAGADDPAEFAISRPTVMPESDGTISMWYARRRPHYCIGYATSSDQGLTWQRRDELVTIAGTPEPWESHERTYPCVFDLKGERYMLYNGNGYGRTGFGLARLEN
ncbi:hypothetical protein ACHMW7_14590 [Aminobacter sp. UC22_36]|uniref:hypothetical protein n=1 Tax=Aminobacter sp. UC22_36 TaxID=3374549 RepID=UPI0037569B9F